MKRPSQLGQSFTGNRLVLQDFMQGSTKEARDPEIIRSNSLKRQGNFSEEIRIPTAFYSTFVTQTFPPDKDRRADNAPPERGRAESPA
jgi:hypothetical protein